MSQRGGSVVTYVRFGKKIYSPVIDKGEADIILSFEQLEAARWFEFLKKDGLVITNTQRLNPMPVITGDAEYPEGLVEKMQVPELLRKISFLPQKRLEVQRQSTSLCSDVFQNISVKSQRKNGMRQLMRLSRKSSVSLTTRLLITEGKYEHVLFPDF